MTFPRYKDYLESGTEWLGEVPSHWRVVLAKRVITVQSGEMISASEETETGYPIIGGNGLRAYTDKTNTAEDTLVIGRVGAQCGCVHHIKVPFWASEHAYRVIEKQPLSKRFFFHLLSALDLNRFAIKTAQPLLNTDIVEMQEIAIPPLDEQSALATFLDRETAKSMHWWKSSTG
jgi:type I restriction enzyme S subunit